MIEPATEAVLEEVPRAGVEEVDEAVARARAAFPAWRALAPGRRAPSGCARWPTRWRPSTRSWRCSRRATPASRSTTRAARSGWSIATFRYYAGAPERLLGDTIPVAGGQAFTFREPLGVVGLIVPWNFPLAIACWKLGPALAAGNTVVLKPAELTPLTALRFARARAERRARPTGSSTSSSDPGRICGQRLVEHPDVAKIAFTGSTEVGRSIAAGAAATIKRVTLELGGKSPNIIFADADLERRPRRAPGRCSTTPARTAARARGSSCRSSVLDRFMALLEQAVKALRVGDPLDAEHRDGAADLGRPARDGRLVRARRRRARRVPRQRARRTRLLVPADGPVPGRPRTPAPSARRSSARSRA